MAGALGDDAALNTPPRQRKVADQVQHLVAHELVGETQRPVLHAVLRENDRALGRRAADQAHVAQLGLVFAESERACRGDLAGVVAGFQVGRELLTADGRREVDDVVDTVAGAGIDADELASVAYLDLPEDADVLAAAALLLQSDRLERLDIRQGAPVEDRQFEIVHFDDHVIDAEADQRREQVLGGRDQHGLAHQAGGVADLGDVAAVGGNLEVVEISPAEDDARAGGRCHQPHRDLGARVQADAAKLNVGPDCLLRMSVLGQGRVLQQFPQPRLHLNSNS